MKKLALIILSILSLCGLSSCKKQPTLPQLKGDWTLVASNLAWSNSGAPGMIATGTGLLAWNDNTYIAPFYRFRDTVFYSSDHGVTWNVVFSDTASHNIVVDMMNNSRVVMYSSADSTLYVSTNGGQSWSVLNHPTITEGYGYSNSIYITSVAGNRLFANYGVLKSDDLGNTWSPVTSIGGYMHLINGSLYLFGQNQISHSVDMGNTWATINSSPPTSYMGQTTNGNFIGSYVYGILKSADTGKTWTSVLQESNPSFSDGSGIAFNTCALIFGAYENASLICCNPAKGNWFDAHAGLSQDYTNGWFVIDNEYVYVLGTVNIQSGNITNVVLTLYRRPLSDFADL